MNNIFISYNQTIFTYTSLQSLNAYVSEYYIVQNRTYFNKFSSFRGIKTDIKLLM